MMAATLVDRITLRSVYRNSTETFVELIRPIEVELTREDDVNDDGSGEVAFFAFCREVNVCGVGPTVEEALLDFGGDLLVTNTHYRHTPDEMLTDEALVVKRRLGEVVGAR